MRRHADRQSFGFVRPFRQRTLGDLRHAVIGTGDHNLRFGVQVGDIGAGTFDKLFHLRQGQAHNRRQAIAVRIGLLHQVATQRDQPKRVGEVQRARNNRRRVCANGQPADDIRRHAASLKLARPGDTGYQ